MKKLFSLLALLAGMTAQAAEDNDTTVIDNAHKVIVVTNDSLQEIKVVGRGEDHHYVYENTIQLVDTNYVSEQRTYNDLRAVGLGLNRGEKCNGTRFDMYLRFYLGFNVPVGVSSGVSFAPLRSVDARIALMYEYTPRNSRQVYSTGLMLGTQWYGLHTSAGQFVKDGTGHIGLVPYPDGASSRHSHLRLGNLSVPLFFGHTFGVKKPLTLTFGPVFNYNFSGRLNTNYTSGDYDFDIDTRNIDIRPFTVDVMAHLRWRYMGCYVRYSPMTVLKDNRGPKFHSVSFGLYF